MVCRVDQAERIRSGPWIALASREYKGQLFIPDLASRVTVLDTDDHVAAQLGDGKGAPDNATNPALFAAPHALCVDSHGDFYVVEWVGTGRPRKFKHTPQRV